MTWAWDNVGHVLTFGLPCLLVDSKQAAVTNQDLLLPQAEGMHTAGI